ncbi:hypothetical protein V6S02_10540 [Microbacterium sp. CCNWLW134]|uniref:hypothetical protein n=1 Tax=Microbacterium sp. CCNWLW134 TaxID=3122064 RepID=UPI00300FBFF7
MTMEIAWEYDTRVWQQQLRNEDGRWRLIRRIKDSRADDTLRRELSARQLEEASKTGSVRFPAPERTTEGAVYALTGPELLGSLLWPDPRVSADEITEVMTTLGGALAELQRDVAAAASVAGIDSPHLIRLTDHLAAHPTTHAGLVVVQQQATVVERLRAWLAELPREGVLCHGGFTLGSVFVAPDLSRPEVPVGDELMASIPELDLGWMLGELTEFEYLAQGRGADPSAYPTAATAFIDGWSSATGRRPDRRWLDRVIALRYFLHLCDFAETTRSTDTGSRNAAFLAWLVERADAPAGA